MIEILSLHPWLLAINCAVLGLIVGSFANVCVYRIPRGESIAFPGSHCPSCGHDLAWYDNIPLLAWLLLRGHCRYCQGKIHWRYPLLEALVGLSWGYLGWHIGQPSLALAEGIILFTMLWILTGIDLETMLLPDILTLPGIAIGLGFAAIDGSWPDAAIGAVAGYSFFWIVARLFLFTTGKEGMGYGDFKLLSMLGAFMGWQALPFIVFFSSVIGAVVGAASLALARKGMGTQIPFGPFLALAGMVWFLWGDAILRTYLHYLR
ncbi:MAG: prepilin peptidase [Mariprofundales bacterium]|nr:prepilin peptidase [Mariprofundales bacterium]